MLRVDRRNIKFEKNCFKLKNNSTDRISITTLNAAASNVQVHTVINLINKTIDKPLSSKIRVYRAPEKELNVIGPNGSENGIKLALDTININYKTQPEQLLFRVRSQSKSKT